MSWLEMFEEYRKMLGEQIGEVAVISRNEVEEVSLEWRIQNFPSLPDDCYWSPVFSFGDEEWWLRVLPNWEREERNPTSAWLGLNLVRRNKGPAKTIRFSVGIRGSGGGVEKSREGEFSNNNFYTWEDFCSRSDLLEHRTRLMPDDTLTVACVLKRVVPGDAGDQLPVVHKKSPLRNEDKCVQVSSEVPRDIESLSSDFSHLLEKEVLPDVRLECGGRTLQAHRSVLVARSEVFRAMFQNGMLESETGAVKIQDMDVEVLQKLLKFLYSGKPDDLSEDCTADLYEAADKYDVHSLKTACAYWIVRNLTEENCVKYLKVSDSHSDHDLKADVVSFITGNPSVMKSEAWLALSKELPVLAVEVLQTYITSTVQ